MDDEKIIDENEALKKYVILLEGERVEAAMNLRPMDECLRIVEYSNLDGIIQNWKSLQKGLWKHLQYVESNLERLRDALAFKN